MTKTLLALAAGLSLCLWVGVAQSGDPKPKDPHAGHKHAQQAQLGEEMEMKPVEVTSHHKVLHDGVGSWKVVVKDWWAPGQVEPKLSYGTSTSNLILDGLAVTYDFETTGDQGPFKGFGVATWNTLTQKYETTWVDFMSYNGIDKMEGTWDPATKTMTWTGMMTMPNGMKMPYKTIDKQESEDKWVSTFWMPEMDGKERKTMEIVSTRVK